MKGVQIILESMIDFEELFLIYIKDGMIYLRSGSF